MSDFTIHESCNATERHELKFALDEAVVLARHAKEHVLIHGHTSPIFSKYFGSGPTAPIIGWMEKVASANRDGIIFRCDDPDRNCATQDGWNGHHRGSNATMETVICELSYISRLPLRSLCARGFDLANGKPARFFSADLLHRLFHVPAIGEESVTHVADSYSDILSLGAGTFTYSSSATQGQEVPVPVEMAGSNSASLYYFALEAFAFDVAVPGVGCPGLIPVVSGASAVPSATSTSEVVKSTAGADAPAVTTEAPVETEIPANCHTHGDGTLHCD